MDLFLGLLVLASVDFCTKLFRILKVYIDLFVLNFSLRTLEILRREQNVPSTEHRCSRNEVLLFQEVLMDL